jgi:hypothetical protein
VATATLETAGYAPFGGDGRRREVTPRCVLAGTQPIRVTNSQARLTIDSFKRAGRTTHSMQGGTLWVVLTWCQQHGVPYTLLAAPGLGYEVRYTPWSTQ